MTMAFSAAKLAALRRLADEAGFISVVSLAGTADLRAMLLEELSAHLSALLLDGAGLRHAAPGEACPPYGVMAALGPVEEAPSDAELGRLKRFGVDGIMVTIGCARAADPAAATAHGAVERIGAACAREGLIFLLGPRLGTTQGGPAHPPEERGALVVAALAELGHERYGVDLFQTESPLPPVGIANPNDFDEEAQTAQAWFDRIDRSVARPWLIRATGCSMEADRRVMTYAVRAGASGYIAGAEVCARAFRGTPEPARVRDRLRDEVVPYLDRGRTLLHAYGRPWTGK
jgi:tagatose 1,6-diphosphate aldolase